MREEKAQAQGTAEPSPAPDAAQVFTGQAAVLRRNVPVALAGLLLNVLVLTYVLWPVHPRGPLLAWLGALSVLICVRAIHAAGYRRAKDDAVRLRRWVHLYMAGSVLTGLLWGAAVLIVPTTAMSQRVFIAFLTGGLAAGSMAAYSAMAWLPHTFIVPATAGVALGLLLKGGPMSGVMAAMVAIFGVLLAIMATAMHGTIFTALRLRSENRGLVAWLSNAKVRAEQLNEELKAEIGERSQTEQALRESEGRFRSLVESATDGIGFTFEGHIYYANQAALDLIGYEAEEVLGMPIERFLATTTLAKDELHQRYLDRVAGKEVPRQYETQMLRKDGTVVDVIFSNSVVLLDGKQGVMSIVKDITERKQVEQELRVAKETAEEATHIKDQFVSLLAHDLRAPLNSILSMLALLGSDADRPLSTEQQRILRMASDQGEATVRMIEDLLHVSRLHTGKLTPELRFVDATAITATVTSLLKPLAGEKHIELRDEVPHRTRLFTDPEMLGKVLYNLLSNAIKFTPRGGHIRLFVPRERLTTLAVQDDGAGVDPALVDDLFRHEVKTSMPGTAGERGTGLGLPLSQDLMRALGGEITLESRPGQGTVFYATLPVVRPKVLVVGRDESLALFVRPHLESIDAEFVGAVDAEDAVHKLGDGVHLVIAETDLQGNGGQHLLQRIREVPGGKSVPLMVIADSSQAGLMEHGFQLGASEIVFKPLVPDDFLVRLRRFIT